MRSNHPKLRLCDKETCRAGSMICRRGIIDRRFTKRGFVCHSRQILFFFLYEIIILDRLMLKQCFLGPDHVHRCREEMDSAHVLRASESAVPSVIRQQCSQL